MSRVLSLSKKPGQVCGVLYQEAKYVESWPSTTAAWAGWSRFDIPVDKYGGVHFLLICTSSTLGSPIPATRQASKEILLSKISKSGMGQRSVYSVVVCFRHRWPCPISGISNIGLSLISELPISYWESETNIRSDIGIKFYPISDIPLCTNSHSSLVL